jgi:hypothetical protein
MWSLHCGNDLSSSAQQLLWIRFAAAALLLLHGTTRTHANMLQGLAGNLHQLLVKLV